MTESRRPAPTPEERALAEALRRPGATGTARDALRAAFASGALDSDAGLAGALRPEPARAAFRDDLRAAFADGSLAREPARPAGRVLVDERPTRRRLAAWLVPVAAAAAALLLFFTQLGGTGLEWRVLHPTQVVDVTYAGRPLVADAIEASHDRGLRCGERSLRIGLAGARVHGEVTAGSEVRLCCPTCGCSGDGVPIFVDRGEFVLLASHRAEPFAFTIDTGHARIAAGASDVSVFVGEAGSCICVGAGEVRVRVGDREYRVGAGERLWVDAAGEVEPALDHEFAAQEYSAGRLAALNRAMDDAARGAF